MLLVVFLVVGVLVVFLLVVVLASTRVAFTFSTTITFTSTQLAKIGTGGFDTVQFNEGITINANFVPVISVAGYYLMFANFGLRSNTGFTFKKNNVTELGGNFNEASVAGTANRIGLSGFVIAKLAVNDTIYLTVQRIGTSYNADIVNNITDPEKYCASNYYMYLLCST